MTTLIEVIQDTHAGSTVALCPEKLEQDDGGAYLASPAQQWLWSKWGKFHDEVARLQDEFKPDLFGLLVNGDAMEGHHHGTTQVTSMNPNAQSKALKEVMAIPLALGPTDIWVVRGTPAHVGTAGSGEEAMARHWFDAGLPVRGDPDTGAHSWYHLQLGLDGLLIDAAHHGRTGMREHTRQNAANLHAHDILLSYVKRGERPPDLCLRAHNHKFNDSWDACPVRVVTLGCWQLRTEWVHKKLTDSMPDIGAGVVIIRDGHYEVKKFQYFASRGTVWHPSN